ncbi:hypothetical protein ACFRAR_36850 [Kitasatospora sp. NPDC056651]|uniref:hypothetical protein n=1 Tax=Kitasatospora sp. NPDC056651 TaxID=3345892 RepID=UPI0036AD510F
MPRSVRCLIAAVAAAFGAVAVAAVHVRDWVPLAPALCVDALVVIGWSSLLALVVQRQPALDPAVDDGGGRFHRADALLGMGGEPRATSHWRGRHWP